MPKTDLSAPDGHTPVSEDKKTPLSTFGEFKNDVKNFYEYGKNVVTGNAQAPDYQKGRPSK